MNLNSIARILKESFFATIRGKFWKWLFGGSFSACAAVFLFLYKYFDKEILVSIQWAGGVVGALFFVRFVIHGIRFSIKHLQEVYKESIYGEAIILLKDSFGKVHRYRKSPGYQDKEFMELMVDICNNLRKIFEKITHASCGISIMVPIKGHVDGNTTLMNLCRDQNTYKSRETDEFKSREHTILGNTSFSRTLNSVLNGSKKRFYFNNNVLESENYKNTCEGCYGEGLPYKSELVHAIIPFLSIDDQEYHCLGFLCVDCENENAFKETKYAVGIVEGVADGLYDIITERNQNKDEKNE